MMKEGAVAVIDALGFRGVWRRYPAKIVIENMQRIKIKLEKDLTEIGGQGEMQFDVAFLSDTIILGLSFLENDYRDKSLSIIYVTDILTRILAWSARSSTPLSYRGTVSYGRFIIEPSFIVGEAIDEATTYHESAQGAVVWLLPSTKDKVADWLKDQSTNTHLVRFNVPLKNGDEFQSYTVSPIVQAGDVRDAIDLTIKILGTFKSNNLEVAIKKQNTIKHLQACYAWRNWEFPTELLK